MNRFLSLAAACLLAGGAWAQQDNPDNPHSTKNKDRQTATVPNSATNAQTDAANAGNPNAYNNKDEAKAQGNTNIDAAEKNNPHHPDYKDRDTAGGDMDRDMMANATPQMQLQKLHVTNLKEIDAGRLAEQNGTAKVKDYARMLQQDHRDADAKVMALAQKKGWTLSDTPAKPEKQQKMQMEKDKLSSLKDAEFDRTFANMMAHGHRHVIEMAQGWKANCKDQDVCALIDQLMPKLQQHQQMAEKLRGPMPQGRAPQQ